MAPQNAAPNGARSGIVTSENGQSHVPASVRPDGSVRKEIKIKPGYRPPEDVEVYKNRTAAAFRSRGTGGVPGAATTEDAPIGATASKANDKNAKRREARKRAKAGDDDKVPAEPGADATVGVTKALTDLTMENNTGARPSGATNSAAPDASEDREKQAKRLRKKLREAREVQEKANNGENLVGDQLAKVTRIRELVRDLEKLGYDANGEPRPNSEAVVDPARP